MTRTVRAGDTVADTSHRLGKVWAADRSNRRVIVVWEDGAREAVEVDDLLTQPGWCSYVLDPGSRYRDPEPPETCPEDTVPGEEYCPEHGGPAWL